MGHAQRYTTTVGGHFHEVSWNVDKNGDLKATCGPALKKITKNTPRGTKTTNEPFKFFNKMDNEWISDGHSHEMEYIGSDELSVAGIRDTQ
jgi:hypothetical protein